MEESTEAPSSVSLRTFLAARTQELVALSQRISGKSGEANHSSVPFKHIPKNLRRRAVSHNVKRLPFRFRPKTSATAATGVKGDPLSFVSSKKKVKAPSRKARRRKGKLLLEFNRRQREFKWLETHIWHAKRFHMTSKWGHKIPVSPCDKGQRALYRSNKNYATMQDISFYSCFEIQANFDLICSGFRSIAPAKCNPLSIGALMHQEDLREGKLHLYKQDSYPHNYIGQVQFYWFKTLRSGQSVLQLWVHPAFSEEVLTELVQVFKLNSVPEVSLESPPEVQSIDAIKLIPKNLQQRPTWTNADNTVLLIDRSGALNRIRFCGPEVVRVFKEVLHPSKPEAVQNDKWTECFNKSELGGAKYLEAQKLLWESLDSFDDFPSQIVIPLVVRDPRVFLPTKRTKVLLDNEETADEEEEMEVDRAESEGSRGGQETTEDVLAEFFKKSLNPLEDGEVQKRLLREKMTDEEFCKRRAGLLIPGSQIELGVEENQIPIVLLHRPASANAKNFSDGGFDVLIPAGWTMAFWIAFAYRAVRVTGLRDAKSCAFESSNLHSSYFLPPDCNSGSLESSAACAEARENYFKLPPAKRPNLIKLACSSPFTPDWLSLLTLWNPAPASSFFILRDSEHLSLLSRNLKTKFWKRLTENLKSIPLLESCLIGIRLELVGRGTATDGALISLPTETDKFPAAHHSVNESPVHEEPPWYDEVQKRARRALHKKHQKNMSFLRRKRKKIREAQRGEEDPDLSEVKHYDSAELSRLYNEQMNDLWLLPKEKTVKSLGKLSRTPVGFVVYGGTEYSRGKCSALGFIAARALLEFAEQRESDKKWPNFLLVRNWTYSFVHRAARFEILRM